jgi:hypothetical protein
MIENIEADYKLWIVDADSKNSWFNYLNYLSRFHISKYFSDLKKKKPLHLHISSSDFPTNHILFVDASLTVSSSDIQKTWKALGEPKTLVFPSTHKVFANLVSIDKSSFVLLQ